MPNFLIVYNRRTGVARVREYPAGHDREAIRARFVEERKHQGNPAIEVVVLSSDSEASLRRTHSRYFKGVDELTSRQ